MELGRQPVEALVRHLGHADLAKRFVRAEVVRFEDFKRVGSMKEAKQHGVYRLEGKTYVVQDGDIMHIL